MKATELRIENYTEYFIKDEIDERKEWWELNKCDIDDIADIQRMGFELAGYRPILLTEEWLRKFGFVDKFKNDSTTLQEKKHRHHIVIRGGKFYYRVPGVTLTEIYFIHELQNLYYALTKEDLVLAVNPL